MSIPTDLVDRLRYYAWGRAHPLSVMSEAADEIERLRTALRSHHDWHLRQGKVHIPDGMGGYIVLDGAAEYADSAMGETTAELLGRADP